MGTLNNVRVRFSGIRANRKEKMKMKEAEKAERRQKSFSRQWMAQSMLILSVVLFVAAGVFVFAMATTTMTGMRSNLTARTNVAVRFFNRYFYSSDSELNAAAKAYIEDYDDKSKLEIQYLDNSGNVLYSSSGYASGITITTDDFVSAMRNGTTSSWFGRDPVSGEDILAVSSPIVFPNSESAGVVRCVTALEAYNKRILSYAGAALGFCVIILSILLLHNRFFIRSILQPLQVVNDTAMQIAEGRYGVHIETNYTNEIGPLCKTINDMSDAISRAEKTKNSFISSISHELRTPLTAIGGWSETLLSGTELQNGEYGEVERGLTIIRDEAARLTRLVEELLDFSRMESGELRMTMERADIVPDLEDVVFMYMDTLRKEGITLEYRMDDESTEIVCDRARLKQVFLNVLDNARKHGGDGKRIIVSAKRAKGTIEISFQDFGAGIAPEELPRVRERFYKGSSKARGNGIGLAVADEIIRLHGGRIDIESELGKGTKVTIVLPVPQ